MKHNVPEELTNIAGVLRSNGHDAYLVGGCVRDLILGKEPKDWDVATDARPEELQKLFPESVYENQFGTVLVKLRPRMNADQDVDERRSAISENLHSNLRKSAPLQGVEITTFRIEGKYSDKRHPDEIKFAKTIEEDLSRRDFTVNAIALDMRDEKLEIRDPFAGRDDLKSKIIRTVGNAENRFREDALRLMRAVRFAVELDFEIELNTRRAIEKLSGEMEMVAKERIRDEFVKILETPHAAAGVILLEELNLLRFLLPELREGIGVGQNKHHIYTVFEHNVRALDYTVKQNYSLVVRMASLLHDVGKPKSKQGDGPDSTFYAHEYIGEKLAVKALDRLRFPKEFIEQVAHLVRCHLFYYNVGEVTESGVRRFLARVGPENIDDLLKVREADRIGSGVPKAFPYKLRHLLFMIEKVKHDPMSPKMLKVTGVDVMKILNIPPSQKVGFVLAILLEEVLDDPKVNRVENLELRIKELGKLSDSELKKLSDKAKVVKEEFEAGAEEEIKKKFHVQ